MLNRLPKRPDVLAQWSRLPVPIDSSTTPAMRRERLVHTVERSMRDTKADPRTRYRIYASLAAAVAMVALAILGGTAWRARTMREPVAARLFTLSGSSRTVVHGREVVSSSAASGGLPLVLNSQVATGRASSSRMQLLSGVEVTVEPETHLTLPGGMDPSSAREELVLELGLIRVQVPKLPRGHSFAIRTPDTWVTVHGTAFSVEVTKSGLSGVPRTTVIVTEGVVTVQHAGREILLEAGSEWTSSVENLVDGAPSSSSRPVLKPGLAPSPSRPPQRFEHESTSATLAAPEARPMREHTANQAALANQNRLFAEAMNARDHGDRGGAIALLDEFIQRYPAAPLAQDAYVERFRVLSEMGKHAAAARAARSYLALYPNGFACEEARQLALGSPTGL